MSNYRTLQDRLNQRSDDRLRQELHQAANRFRNETLMYDSQRVKLPRAESGEIVASMSTSEVLRLLIDSIFEKRRDMERDALTEATLARLDKAMREAEK